MSRSVRQAPPPGLLRGADDQAAPIHAHQGARRGDVDVAGLDELAVQGLHHGQAGLATQDLVQGAVGGRGLVGDHQVGGVRGRIVQGPEEGLEGGEAPGGSAKDHHWKGSRR